MCNPEKQKTRPAFAKTGLDHALAVFVKRPQAVDQIGAGYTLLFHFTGVKSRDGIRSGSVQIELIVFRGLFIVLAARVALPLHRSKVFAGYVSGNIYPVEA